MKKKFVHFASIIKISIIEPFIRFLFWYRWHIESCAAHGHVCTTGAWAAPGLLQTKRAGAAPRGVYTKEDVSCKWACPYHRDLRCTWTFLQYSDNRSLFGSWTLHYRSLRCTQRCLHCSYEIGNKDPACIRCFAKTVLECSNTVPTVYRRLHLEACVASRRVYIQEWQNFDSLLSNPFIFWLSFLTKNKGSFFLLLNSKSLLNLFASLRYCLKSLKS